MYTKNFTSGSILGNILSFALPYSIGYFLQILYGLTDLYFIGRYGTVNDTTAVANAAQLMHMFTVVSIGLSVGTTVRIGRAIGENDHSQIQRIIGNTTSLFLVFGIFSALLLFFCRTEIINLINTPTEAVESAKIYLTITFLGIPFILAYNVIASIYRGLGDTQTPMVLVAATCVENILLDISLIGHLGIGTAGAALATVISQFCSVIIALFIIRKNPILNKISRHDFKPDKRQISNILKIGVPISAQDGFIQVAFITITLIANCRGLNDAAAVGIVEKFIGLIFIIPSAMLSSVSTISAQNIGAKRLDRAQQTMKKAIYITLAYGIVIGILLQIFPEHAVRIFTNDVNVIKLGGEYLKGYAWDCAIAGVHFCFSGFFTACGLSIISFTHNLISIVCARIPLSYLASVMFPATLYPMGLAIPAGSFLSVVICVAFYIYLSHKSFVFK